jgi:predicted enzyme related to lactoylglutathione lyase
MCNTFNLFALVFGGNIKTKTKTMSKVVHFEVPASEPEKLGEFYKNVFDWKVEKWGEEDYWMLKGEGEMGIDGAIYKKGEMDHVMNTIEVSDIEEAMEKLKANGGEVIGEPHDIPDVGRHVYFKDPEGNMLGLLEPEEM